jgi:hypothetical protein
MLDYTITDAAKKESQEFLSWAYHYFNSVRLYGGVLVDKALTSEEALKVNRASEDDISQGLLLSTLKKCCS